MRRALLVLLFGVFPAALTSAHGSVDDGHEDTEPTGNHSPSVKEFYWLEAAPARGESITAWLVPVPEANLTRVLLNVCRVESYSCRSPIEMNRGTNTDLWGTLVPWDRSFYRGARTVGLSLLMEHANGTREKSPVDHWPNRPPTLPGGADAYYYYTLPPEPRSLPGPAPLVAVVAAAFLAARWRP